MASAGPYASLHLTPHRQPCQHLTTQFSTSRMPFLPPNQQHQSTEGNYLLTYREQKSTVWDGHVTAVYIALFNVCVYATEVMQLSKHSLKLLIFCVAKIFNTYVRDCINQVRLACDLPDVSMIIECRRMKFMNNMLENEHLRYLGLHDWWW